MTRYGLPDPLETYIASSLVTAGIKFERSNKANLDFYLPDFDIYIECKAFYSPRLIEQMNRAEHMIVIKGLGAAKSFAAMLGDSRAIRALRNTAPPPESAQAISGAAANAGQAEGSAQAAPSQAAALTEEASATEPRKRYKDETLLTHQIRCYAEYVREEEAHGPNRFEIANILSAHASYISEYIDRLTQQGDKP